jgi:hypothetical protein
MADPRYIIRLRRAATCHWCQTAMPGGTQGYMVAHTWVHPECADAWDRDGCTTEAGIHPGHGARGKTCTEV